MVINRTAKKIVYSYNRLGEKKTNGFRLNLASYGKVHIYMCAQNSAFSVRRSINSYSPKLNRVSFGRNTLLPVIDVTPPFSP